MTIVHPVKLLFICTITSLLTACGGSSSTPAEPSPPVPLPIPIVQTLDYQKVIDDLISDEIPGIVMLVETPEKRFIGSAGVSNKETQQAMLTSDRMPTASTGKKMIALLAIQLADEGIISLDDTLDIWLSEDILSRIVNSHQMTIRQLLTHTSGVLHYDEVDDGDAYTNLLVAAPEVPKTDIDFLELIYDQPAYFLPGQGYEYSSSGYSLVALVMDKALGEHHSIAMRNRFFDPLGMSSTYYKGSEASLGSFISGYISTEDGELDTKPFLINASEAGSTVISTVDDMAIFLKALITDNSFANEAVKDTMFGEGSRPSLGGTDNEAFGIAMVTLDGHKVYAHAGLTFGYSSQSIYIEDTDTSIVIFFNCGDGGVNTCSTAHDDLIETVLDNEIN
jgi:D-alanyl-D-alanine carboxypeptidase